MNEKKGITSSAFLGSAGTILGVAGAALALPGLSDCVRMTGLIVAGAVMIAYVTGNALVKRR